MKTVKTFEKLFWLVPVEVSFLENFPPREREQATWRDDQGIEIKILEFLLGKKLFETQKRTVKRRHNNSEPGIYSDYNSSPSHLCTGTALHYNMTRPRCRVGQSPTRANFSYISVTKHGEPFSREAIKNVLARRDTRLARSLYRWCSH